jgi:hypothetical protein
MLVTKGVLTETEGNAITSSGTVAEQRDRLAVLLREKGIISAAEYEAVHTVVPVGETVALSAKPTSAKAEPAQPPTPQATPPVIAAVAPTRMLPIDLPKREGLIPDVKIGAGARLKLYGFFKTSIIHDSSSPLGNDFPLPLLAGDTGPDGSPEFHLKARSFRFGANFEWVDPAPKTVVTGKFEQSQHLFDSFKSTFDSTGLGPHRSQVLREHVRLCAIRSGLDSFRILDSSKHDREHKLWWLRVRSCLRTSAASAVRLQLQHAWLAHTDLST